MAAGGADALSFKILRDALLSPNAGAKRGDIAELMQRLQRIPFVPQDNGDALVRTLDIPHALRAALGLTEAAASQTGSTSDPIRRIGNHIASFVDPFACTHEEMCGIPVVDEFVMSRSVVALHGRSYLANRQYDESMRLHLTDGALFHPSSVVLDETFLRLQEPALREVLLSLPTTEAMQ
jgi:hypothetical protein